MFSLVLREIAIVLRSRDVDQGAMGMKEYSALPKSPALLKPYHPIV